MTSIYIHEGTVLPKRAENDLYKTEINLISEALRKYARPGNSVLDVGAGDGRWGIATALMFPQWVSRVDMVDVTDQEFVFEAPPGVETNYFVEDFLKWEAPRQYDLIVSNPPYFIAEECIRKSWDLLRPGGMMMFLLRLSFLEGVGRHNGLFNELPMSKVAVCSRRPSFYGNKTNATAFAVYIWEKRLDERPHGLPNTWTTTTFVHARGGGDTQELLEINCRW